MTDGNLNCLRTMNCNSKKRTAAANFKILFTSSHGRFLYIKRTYKERITATLIFENIQSRTKFSRCGFLKVCYAILGREIGPLHHLYLHREKQTQGNVYTHLCSEWNLNKRTECSSSQSQFVAEQVRSLNWASFFMYTVFRIYRNFTLGSFPCPTPASCTDLSGN
jgi:hypothetical protein